MNLIKQKNLYRFLCFVAFGIWMAATKFGYHELWKDEWQSWFVSSDQNFFEMLSFLNYEGHPALYYLYLKFFSFFSFLFPSQEEFIIQFAHLFLILGFSFVFFLKFRMALWIKIFLAVGYFFSFEYGIVNRGYALVMFLSFWIVHLIQIDSKRIWLFIVLLFLLCQTEVYGVFIAGGLLLYRWLKLSDDNLPKPLSILNLKEFYGLAIGFLVFVLTVFPRGNRDDFSRAYNQKWFDGQTMMDAFQGLLANNFLIGCIPDTSAMGSSGLGILLSIIVMAALIFLFFSHKKLLLSFLSGFFVFYLFCVVIYNGGIRQWGMFFVYFICCLELLNLNWSNFRNLKIFIPIIFGLFQIAHSFKAFQKDYLLPFTNAQITGEFIKEKVPQRVPIIAMNKFECTSVVGYADRAFYELPSGEEFTFFKWLEKIYVPTESELQLFGKFKKVGGIILLSPTPIDQQRFPNAKLWQSFDEPNFKQENYYLYTLSLKT